MYDDVTLNKAFPEYNILEGAIFQTERVCMPVWLSSRLSPRALWLSIFIDTRKRSCRNKRSVAIPPSVRRSMLRTRPSTITATSCSRQHDQIARKWWPVLRTGGWSGFVR